MTTTAKSIIANRFNVAAYGDGGQAAATIEGVVANTGHRVGDGDGGNTKYILVKPICVCEPIKWGKAN